MVEDNLSMRRNVIALVLLTVISLVLSTAAFAQQKASESDQIVTVTGKAERRLDSISFRMTLKTEWFTERDGDIFTEALETFVKAEPDRYQSISQAGQTRVETVVVGNKTFRRTDDADWASVAVATIRKSGDESTAARFGELAGGAFFPVGSGKLIDKGTIDGVEVSMYEVRNVLQDRTTERGSRTETKTYWINNDGLIVRRVIEHEFQGDKRLMRSTANYSYIGIRVEEPILPVTAKK